MHAAAKNIKRLRQREKLTQEQVAERLHVTRQAVSSWETGKTQPDIETLAALAAVLGTDANELIYGPAAGSYPRFQRRYVVLAVVCGLVLAAAVALDMTLRPALKMRQMETYDIMPLLHYSFLIPALQYLAAGMLGPAAVSLWGDIRVRSRRVRRVCLVLGILALGVYLVWPSLWFTDFSSPRWLRLWFATLSSNGYETLRYGPMFLSGLFFYLGLNR